MHEDQVNAKLRAAGLAGQATTAGCCVNEAYKPATLCEQAEKSAAYHQEMAEKQYRAAVFLRDNPAFDEFVRLVRQGVIQFLVLICFCVALSAQTKHDIPVSAGQNMVPADSKPEAPKPPVIPDDVQKIFFKSQSEYGRTQMAAKVAEDAYNAQIKALQDACGPLWQAQIDRDGFPFCGAKAPETKSAGKK